jgi:hypothetical protein
MVPRVCQLVAVVDEVAGPEGRAQSVGGFRLEFLKADEEAMLWNLRAFIDEFHTRLALVRCLCVALVRCLCVRSVLRVLHAAGLGTLFVCPLGVASSTRGWRWCVPSGFLMCY